MTDTLSFLYQDVVKLRSTELARLVAKRQILQAQPLDSADAISKSWMLMLAPAQRPY